MDEQASRWEAITRARIIADPRKFREYVLVPGHPNGKDRNFLGTLGFRPHSGADAWLLEDDVLRLIAPFSGFAR